MAPYPERRSRFEDRLVGGFEDDAFGRLTGIGLIDDAVEQRLDLPLLGVAVREWIRFLAGVQMAELA